jgi:hypothetical protein
MNFGSIPCAAFMYRLSVSHRAGSTPITQAHPVDRVQERAARVLDQPFGAFATTRCM